MAQDDVDSLSVARDVLRAEADAILAMAEGLGENFQHALDLVLAASGRVICCGIGKSGHVARKIAATLSSTGTAAYFVHPTEASHGDLGMIQPGDVVIAISRSGETAELGDIIQYSQRFEIPLIAITSHPDSALGRPADVVLQLPDAPEACAETNAPTTSTTLSMALGDAIAVALLKRRGFAAQDFKMYHPGGKLGAMLKTAADLMRSGERAPVVDKGASLTDALTVLSEKGLGCVCVIEGDDLLVGIVTDGDIRRSVVSGRQPRGIVDIMSPAPLAVAPGVLAGRVLQLMNERKVTQIPVVLEGRFLGIVHMHDVLIAGIA